MTDRDPNLFRDRFEDERIGGDDGLELPLEMFFAEDRGDPRLEAVEDALESDVLSRVGAERGFVSRRERSVIRRLRGVALAGAFCIVLAAAVADRLGVAPWVAGDDAAMRGPVSRLVASTTAETAGTVEQARHIREQLLRVVEQPAQKAPHAVEVTLRPVGSARSAAADVRRHSAVVEPLAGPYLTARGFGVASPCLTKRVTTVIRFEDGFSVPAMACESSSELRWPASREITASVV
ncbi:MAG: hypothetical protein AAFO89_02785, partial [Planctomycetota bacterium]